MRCFSRPVKLVANTNTFARASQDGRQFLAYSLLIDANEELAMILPIPATRNSKEDAVEFINLEDCANFFDEMRSGFPVRETLCAGRDPINKSQSNKLEVKKVCSAA